MFGNISNPVRAVGGKAFIKSIKVSHMNIHTVTISCEMVLFPLLLAIVVRFCAVFTFVFAEFILFIILR